MPFGESFPPSLLSFLIFFHLFLWFSPTDSCKQPRVQSHVDADGGKLFTHAKASGSHTHWVLAIADSWRRVTVGRHPPHFQPLYFLGDELEILSTFCGQTARRGAVSVAEKIGSRREEKSEERKGAKSSKSARQWVCGRWRLGGGAASSGIINEDNLVKKTLQQFPNG